MAGFEGWNKSKVQQAPDLSEIKPAIPISDPVQTYQDVEPVNPDELGETNRLTRKLDADPKIVQDNRPAAKHAAAQPDWNNVKAKTPSFYDRMKDPAFAALVKDDIENTAKLEQVFNPQPEPELTLGRLGSKAYYSFTQSIADMANNVVAYYEKFDPENPQDQEAMTREFTVTDRGRYNQKIGELIGNGMEMKQARVEALRFIQDDALRDARQVSENKALQIPEYLRDSSGLVEDVVGGLSGSAVGIATTAINPLFGTLTFGSQIGGGKYRELRQQGVDPNVASNAALISAIGQAPLESLGAVLQVKGVKTIFSAVGRKLGIPGLSVSSAAKEVADDGWGVLAKDVFKAIGVSAVGEGFEEYLQNFPDMLADVYAERPDASVGEILSIFMDRVPEEAVSKEALHSALVGALSGAVLTGGGLAVSVPTQISRRNTVQKRMEQLEALVGDVSKLKERDDVAYRDYVSGLAQDNGVDEIFMQGDVLNQSLEQEGVNKEEWLARYGATVADLQNAVLAGGDVALSSSALGDVSTDQVLRQSIGDIKVASVDSTLNSLEADIESDDQATVRLRELFEEKQVNKVSNEHIARLETSLQEHAKAVGITGFTKENVRSQVALIAGAAEEWSRRMTEKTGRPTTVDDFFDAFNIQIGEVEPVDGDVFTAGQQYDQAGQIKTETPAFNEWFGESQVVDEQGEPLVVYHGTAERFEEFDPERAIGTQFWFTNNRAAIEAGEVGAQGRGVILDVHLSIKNPAGWDEYDKFGIDELIGRGFDGLALPDPDGTMTYVAFEPTQIKSVDNRGTFDPTDPNILAQPVFHGTPHKFDKFSLEAIGTGEGAQAFGWGLYFAGKKEIAEFYRDQLVQAKREIIDKSRLEVDGEVVDTGDEDFSILRSMADTSPSEVVEHFKNRLSQRIDQLGEDHKITKAARNVLTKVENVFAKVENKKVEYILDVTEIKPEGQLFQVDIPEDDVMLHWDKPLDEQPEMVRDQLLKFRKDAGTSFNDGEQAYSAIKFEMRMRGEGKEEQAASKFLDSLGIKGVKYADATSRTEGSDPTFNYVIFDDSVVTIEAVNDELVQANILAQDGDGRRAQIAFDNGRKDATIGLTPKADLSSFLHETGHLFLEVVRISNEQHGIYEEEWATIKDFLGAEDGVEITREQHEQWAEAFERYLSEGKAPSIELQTAFDKFKSWLTKIYQNIADRFELSDEVRDVMDRLIATEQQIEDARATDGLVSIIDNQAFSDLGATQEEISELQEKLGLSEDQAKRLVDLHRLGNLKDRRKEYKEEAEQEWQDRPSTVLIKNITEAGGLDKALLIDQYGEDILSSLPKNVGLIRIEGGSTVNTLASEFDIENGELISTLQGHMTKSDYVDSRVSQMEADHDATVSEEEAVHNESLRVQMAQESALLQKITRRKKVLADRQLKAFARQTVSQMDRKRIRAINKSIGDVRRARLAANKAVKKRDYDLALKENEKARIAEAVLQEQIKARDHLEVVNRRLNRILKSIKKNPGKYEPSFRDQIVRLGKRFEMQNSERLQMEEDVTLVTFIDSINAAAFAGDDDLIDLTAGTMGAAEWLYDETIQTPFPNLSFEQAQDVDDLIRMFDKVGRVDASDILSTGEKISELLPELLAEVDKMTTRGKINEFTMGKGIKRWARQYEAEQVPLQYLLMSFDGYDTSGRGRNIERLFNPLSEASAQQHLIIKEIKEQLEPVLKNLKASAEKWPRVLTHLAKPHSFANPENSDIAEEWTFDKVLAFALNLGNADNTQKLLDGYEMSYDQALDVIGILSESDLKNVQKIWDIIDTLWPKTAATHRELYGFTPKKIETVEFVIPGQEEKTINGVTIPSRSAVTLRGGYYPLKFDPGKSTRQSKQDDKASILENQDNIYPSVKTPQGFTIARQETAGGKPVQLSMNVLTDHISHVAHHVTHALHLSDVDRITKTKEYQTAITDKFGSDVARMIKPALAKVANPRGGGSTLAIDKVLEGERSRATAYILWYNARVALKQPYSLFNLAQAMGGQSGKFGNAPAVSGYIARAYGEMLKDPRQIFKYRDMVHRLSPNMENRSKAIDRELMKPQNFGAIRKISKKETVEQALESISDHTGPVMIRIMDFAAAYPGWVAAYRQGMDIFNGDEKRAATYADGIVSATQPFDRPLDQSKIRGEKKTMARWFTLFSGYTMKFANRRSFYWKGFKQYIETGGQTGIGPVEFMSHAMLERVAPSIAMSFMISMVFEGEPPDAEDILLDLLLFQFAGRYLVQDIASAAVAIGRRGFQQSPLSTPLDTGAEMIVDSYKTLVRAWETGDIESAMSAMADLLEYKYKLPISRGARQVEKLAEAHE